MSHSLKLGLTVAALAALGLSAANPAAAQTTIYNFQVGSGGDGQGATYTGVGVLGNGVNTTSTFNRETQVGTGTTNQVGGAGFGTVLDSNGASTALTFAYDANSASLYGTATAANPGALLQFFALTTSKSNISLKGLTANTPFTAVFYSENGNYADGRQTKFNLTDSTFGTSLATATTTANSATAFTTNPGNYVTFTGTTDASGGIFATYALVSGNEGDFNGAQFQVGTPSAAPEPAQLAGLGFTALGALGLILKSRKRSVTPKNAA